ncbi:MAG: tetratricopeptide repeat protein [Holophagales bacterium]|nr:tetratricopeptide repeat protein [Holophagales bacterium]
MLRVLPSALGLLLLPLFPATVAAPTPDEPRAAVGAAAEALAEGGRALEAGALDRAEAAFLRAAETDPPSPLPWLGLAAVDERRGDLLAALAHARRAQGAAPRNPAVLERIAGLQVRVGAAGEALETLERWRSVEPEEPRAYLLAALVSRDVERLDDAVDLLRRARSRARPDPAVDEQLAMLLLSEGETAEALAVASAASDDHPGHPGLALARGLALAADGSHLDEAVAWLQKALRLGAPGSGRIHLELGSLLGREGCHAEALEHFHAAVEAMPDSAEAHYRLGGAQRACGDGQSARASLERFRALTSREEERDHGRRAAGAALNGVRELASAGEVTRALESLDTLAAEHPEDDRIYLLRAKILFSAGRREAAYESAVRARSLLPSRVEAHYLEGLFASQIGRLGAAEEALRRALTLDAEEAGSHALLAAVLADRGEHEEAASHFEKALIYGGDGAPLRLAYAKVLATLGRTEDSARQMELYRQLAGK